MKLDEVSVATGLLHDVVEDTLVDLDTIRRYFGEEITHLVDGLTKIAQISNISREEQQAENVRKMLLAMVDDVRVVLVKLADRLHNMRTLQYLNPEKRKRIAQETMDIFAPIAHRLGMGKLRGELEDLAFRHLHPEDYRELAEQLEKRRPENEAFLKNVTARIEQKMNEAEVPFVNVEGRVKRLYSIWKKLRAQKISWTRFTIWSRRDHHSERDSSLLRRARSGPSQLEAGSGSHQRLDCNAARQFVPVAAHFCNRVQRAIVRGPDPD